MIDAGRNAASQRVSVFAIGRDDGVVRVEGLHDAHGDRLLTDAEVHEAADARRAVELDATFLEPADPCHLAQQAQGVRRLDAGGCVRVVHESIAHAADLQRRQVALRQPEVTGAEQPAHDLAAGRLGEVLVEGDLAGGDGGAEADAAVGDEVEGQLVARLEPVGQADERLDDLAGDRIGHPDDAGLDDRRMLHQDVLDLDRSDEVAGRLDDVVGAGDEPVARPIASRRTTSPVRYQPSAKHRA